MSIMVDNIDVTKCSFYNDGKCRSLTHLVQGEYINCNSMCDYGAYARKEQLKRLQVENELLKDANAHLKTELKQRYDEPDFKSFRLMGKTIDEWKQLETENDLLKRFLNDILRIFNLGQYDFLKDQNEIIMALEKAVQKDKEFYEFTELNAENEQLKALCNTYFTCYKAKHNDIEGKLFSYRKTLKEIREILFPKNKWLITDCEEILEIRKIIKEVLSDEIHN